MNKARRYKRFARKTVYDGTREGIIVGYDNDPHSGDLWLIAAVTRRSYIGWSTVEENDFIIEEDIDFPDGFFYTKEERVNGMNPKYLLLEDHHKRDLDKLVRHIIKNVINPTLQDHFEGSEALSVSDYENYMDEAKMYLLKKLKKSLNK